MPTPLPASGVNTHMQWEINKFDPGNAWWHYDRWIEKHQILTACTYLVSLLCIGYFGSQIEIELLNLVLPKQISSPFDWVSCSIVFGAGTAIVVFFSYLVFVTLNIRRPAYWRNYAPVDYVQRYGGGRAYDDLSRRIALIRQTDALAEFKIKALNQYDGWGFGGAILFQTLRNCIPVPESDATSAIMVVNEKGQETQFGLAS